MRRKLVPPGTRHLRLYSELRSYLTDFVEGRYPFLWVSGRPGIGKTEGINAATCGRTVYYRKGGQLTPLQFYIDCYHHRGEPIILDDADPLLEESTGVGAKHISALGETTPVKRLYYGSTSHHLGEVPQSYSTTSPLCIISNKPTGRPDIQSRAVILHFDPTNLEVHKDAAQWFWDQEIHDFFGSHLSRLRPLETRWYVIASDDKRAGRDWRQILLDTTAEKDKTICLVQDLERDAAHPTREDKARRYEEMMGGGTGKSRATYFRIRARLKKEGRLNPEIVEPIPLRRTRPPARPTQAELDALESGLAAPPQEEEHHHPDLPARDAFSQPIQGSAPPHQEALDDLVAWEQPPGEDAEEDENDSE